MKAKLLFLFFLVSVSLTLAQVNPYPHVSIRDIQYVPDSLLSIGKDASLKLGDTVQVTGVVMVSTVVDPSFDRRVIMYAGARWQTYLRDTSYSNVEWAGINVIQNDITSAAQGTLMDLLDTTMVVTITGVIAEFVPQTQINVLTNPIYPIQFLPATKTNRGEPIELTIDSLNIGNAQNLLSGEKYEGMYIIIRNVITSDRNATTGTFIINDGNGNQMYIHDQSGYFTKRTTHKLREWDPPIDGTTIQYIRGVVGHFSNPNRYVLRPMYTDDLLIGQSPPAISNISRDADLIAPNQAVSITARILDIDQGGSVTGAKIKYRVNSGERLEVNMTANADTTWSGTIPGVALDSALVDFYIWAQDNDGMSSVNPIDTVKGNYFYLVLNRPLTIQDVQYSPFGSGYSAYNNYRVTVSGVVTADTTDLQGDGNQVGKRVYIQNGQGQWSGIWVFGTNADALVQGENVTIVDGKVTESNNNTRLDSIVQIIINTMPPFLPIPDPEYVTTADIGTVVNGTISAEIWEGVLIEYHDVIVTDDNADGASGPTGGGNYNYGEIIVADPSNVNTRVELQEGNHEYHNLWVAGLDTVTGNIRILEGDSFDKLRGVLFYSFGNYKIVPRKSDDFVGYTVSVDENPNALVNDYNLSQNYPNPFNPVTNINYSIVEGGFVQIKIFNILGQDVKTLINMEQPAGNYTVRFDASSLPSGVYLYQINVNNYLQTKKMILMK